VRFTQDVDFAVSVADDAEAEEIVHRMSVRGYGTVDCRLADLGLSAAERRQSLAPYAERFGTQDEAVR
jgi:hypothetical protein